MNIVRSAFRPALIAVAAAAALSMAGGAQAVAVSGNFGINGYDNIGFSVGAPSTVDMVFTGGLNDATFSLFDAAGAHIVTNDDSNGLNPHITLNLGSGFYTLMVSFCCESEMHANQQGAPYVFTDGFNSGDYLFGGSATLTSMENFITANSGPQVGRQPYALTISNVALGNNVPEPTSLALAGLALVGLQLARKRA